MKLTYSKADPKKNKKAGHILSGTATRDNGLMNIFSSYIGIDPDIKESGVAIYWKPTKVLTFCCCKSFFDLFDLLKNVKQTFDNSFVVHIEGGWLIEKSNFHTDEKKGFHTIKESRTAQRIAKNVGNNHQVGKLIIEMCIYLDISFLVREPQAPRFADEKLFKMVTGWQGKTNADARSAANYVFGY